jgi:hypothetical protein
LIEELRLYKDRAGLSLAALATKSAYSTTSWHRYLNGHKLPPWQAVDLLGRLAEADRGRLRVLWESAADAWQDGNGAAPREEAASGDGVRKRTTVVVGRRTLTVGAVVVGRRTLTVGAVLGAGALVAVLALLRPWADASGSGPVPRGAPAGAPTWPWPLPSSDAGSAGVDCHGPGCQGRDPYREGCDRFSTVVHALRAYGTVLTLRYSAVCRTVWAEAAPSRGTRRLLVTAQGAATRHARPGASRTAMTVAGPRGALACLVVADRHQLCVTEHDSWAEPVSGDSSPG